MVGATLLSRRTFLTGGSGAIRPPGFSELELDACTGCGACVETCPTRIISLVKEKPVLDFSRGECTFCGDCAAACPESVFDREKPLAFSHIAAISDRCLARLGVACMTCRDACPEGAIRLRPRIGGPFVPEVAAALCTGCGACMGPCPSGAIAPARPEGDTAHA